MFHFDTSPQESGALRTILMALNAIVNMQCHIAIYLAAYGKPGRTSLSVTSCKFSRDLGTNLARQGIRVNALSLGPIETPQLTEAFSRISEHVRKRRFSHMPLGRFGKLDELAGTVAFLASEYSGFITASVFPLDGGIQHAFTIPE